MTTLQEAAMRKALELGKRYAKCLMMNQAPFDEAIESLRTALAQQGDPVAWRHNCNALCTDGLELWIDHCPHCGKPRTTHAEQWPPGLITDIVLTVTALHKEVDIGWSPDARSHLSRLSTSIGMLATTHPAPQPAQVGINGLTEAETSASMSVLGLSKPAQEATTGCACRWDTNDNRVATCERHQGWLDVISEWADRAKAAEAALQSAQLVAQYDKTEMNAFVQVLYDQKMQEGKHGHYETMFHVVHKAIARVGIKEGK